MIAGRAIDKRLGGRAVLAGLSVEVERGSVLAIVGPNGAGKSTLLRVLAGELAVDAGAVTIDGDAVGALDERALARRRALLPQHAELVFEFEVRELVLLGRTPVERFETKACFAMADRCLTRVGLLERARELASALSGGERQRAHLARALCQIGLGETGSYLLLDEPMSGQDPAWQLRLLEELRTLAGAGVGVAIVLHDLNLAARISDRLMLLRDGRVIARGAPEVVLDPEPLSLAFDVDVEVDSDPWDPSIRRVSFRGRERPPR